MPDLGDTRCQIWAIPGARSGRCDTRCQIWAIALARPVAAGARGRGCATREKPIGQELLNAHGLTHSLGRELSSAVCYETRSLPHRVQYLLRPGASCSCPLRFSRPVWRLAPAFHESMRSFESGGSERGACACLRWYGWLRARICALAHNATHDVRWRPRTFSSLTCTGAIPPPDIRGTAGCVKKKERWCFFFSFFVAVGRERLGPRVGRRVITDDSFRSSGGLVETAVASARAAPAILDPPLVIPPL